MLLEFIIILATIFIINICFYKQTNPEYKILQVEQGDLTKIPPLISELSPIVVRGFHTPNFWTQEDISARARLKAMPLIYKGYEPFPLGNAKTMALPTAPSATAELLAQETGIRVWAEHTILPSLDVLWYKLLLQLRTYALIGDQGFVQTTALLTILMPTDGDVQITLLHKKQYPFCPDVWKHTMPNSWTKATTPLIGEVQFIEVIVRKGSMLVLPPHWRYSYRGITSPKPMVALIEIHHPISLLALR